MNNELMNEYRMLKEEVARLQECKSRIDELEREIIRQMKDDHEQTAVGSFNLGTIEFVIVRNAVTKKEYVLDETNADFVVIPKAVTWYNEEVGAYLLTKLDSFLQFLRIRQAIYSYNTEVDHAIAVISKEIGK